MSHRPGMRNLPRASMAREPFGARVPGPTSTMRLPASTTSICRRGRASVPSTTVTSRKTTGLSSVAAYATRAVSNSLSCRTGLLWTIHLFREHNASAAQRGTSPPRQFIALHSCQCTSHRIHKICMQRTVARNDERIALSSHLCMTIKSLRSSAAN